MSTPRVQSSGFHLVEWMVIYFILTRELGVVLEGALAPNESGWGG